MTLNADGGVPGDALCTLIAPASLSERSMNTFAAPASGTTCPVLEKETTYFVVVERVRVTGSGAIAVSGTASGSEDAGAAEGWSIADGSATYSPHDAAQGWASDAFSYKIEVRGSFINNPASGQATVTGTPQVKRTLAAAVSDVSDDDGLTRAAYSYQWMRVDGATETNIGSGSSTYTLVAEDLGKRIKVRVAFVDDRGNYETLTSEATAAVEVFKAEDRPGTVSLFPARPRVGTVVSAALSDPDGLEGGGSGPAASLGAVSWGWARSPDGTTWTGVEAYGEGDSYVPTEQDEEMLLRAEASYTDGHGPGKSAEAVSTAVVGAREPGPELTVTEIVTGLSHPWGIDFTPDGTMLFTQRAGVLNARLTDGTVKRVDADLGDLLVDGFAGLQALAVDPDFTTNRRFYTLQGHTGREMQVIAWTIDADYDEATRVVDPLVKGMPIGPGPWHSGGRLLFGPEGYLWIVTGDGRVVTGAQDLTSLGGKVLRVDPRTGAGAPGNPFGASSQVYAYGFRNPQGLARRPGTDQMWLVEHGPKHDDEINLLAPGGNYGWDPIPDDDTLVFYDYSDEAGVPMTDLAKFPSARQARWSSGFPTLATSGAVFLDGPQWGEWEGRLAVATLKTKSLRVFEFTEQGDFAGQIVVPELDGSQGRLRTPVLGPDGALYIATSNKPGVDRILRVTANRAATGAPSITGTPRVGETLTADALSVADADGLTNVAFSYQWMRLDGAIETNIGTGSSSYTLVAEDSGKTIKVRVAFTDDAGNEEDLTSAATEAVAPTAPGAPKSLKVSVHGTGTLDVSWEAPDSDGGSAVTGYRVQWKEAADSWTASEDVSEEAATGTVHKIAGLRDGVEHTVRVIAVNDAGPGPASGAVSGTPGTLWSATLTVGAAKNFAGYSSFAQGEENNTLGALSSDTITLDDASYTVKALGVVNGKLILSVMPKLTADFVLVVGTDEFASTDASTLERDSISIIRFQWNDRGLDLSEGEEVAVRVTEPAENTPATGLPTITGTTQVGETLTVDTSAIADEDGLDDVSYTYQWIANDGTTEADIEDATDSDYTPPVSDVGKTIKVKVSFTDDADNEETLTSEATVEVAAASNRDATGAPTISGTPQVRETLTVDTADIADEDGLTNVAYRYQWSAGGSDINGATSSTYTLTASEQGKTIKVKVSFTDDADNEETLTSEATVEVAAAPNRDATGAPTISGTPQVRETLTADTADIADEDGLTNVAYRYQWTAGGSDINGATSSTYTLTASEQGKTIKVKVTFTDDADNEEALTSADTDTVAATKPGVPGHLNVFPHDAEALDVYWEAPASDGGSDITGYKVQWKESADSWDTPADVSEETASGTIHTITGLTDGVEYSVRVMATNGVGDSPPSVEQTGRPRETNAPEMVRPRVVGATLKVLYDETLDEGSAPPTDSFDVRVACTCDDTTWLDEESKRAVESVSVDGDTVVLTLVSAATSEDVVVVSYTPPSDAATARTRDLAGNAAAGFNFTEVFNDTDETAESEEDGEPEETTEGETLLTVSLEASTESHNGTGAFTFELRFSEEFPLSYKTLRDLAFTVSGGEVLKAQRLDKPSNIRWLITVEPDGNGDVTIELPATTDCNAEGAICTADGRKLSNRLEVTVSGPDG